MSEFRVNPVSRLEGEPELPGDKSISHRAAILGAMAEGKTVVRPFLRSAIHNRHHP